MPSKYTVKVRIYHFVAVLTPVPVQVEIRKVVPELSSTYYNPVVLESFVNDV